jgi:hypothetical protein
MEVLVEGPESFYKGYLAPIPPELGFRVLLTDDGAPEVRLEWMGRTRGDGGLENIEEPIEASKTP